MGQLFTKLLFFNKPEIVKVLLKYGANIYIRDSTGNFPMFYIRTDEMRSLFERNQN